MAAASSADASLSMPAADSPASTTAGSARIHYLDNLRALAMMLGVFLHAALAYAEPAQTVWLATDPTSSVAVDASIWFIHLFRMSLFFLVSGYFAKLMVQRKGTKAFLWNRSLRIAVPFVLFYPFLFAAMSVLFVFALSYLDEPRGLMGLIAAAVEQSAEPHSEPPEGLSPGTMHLWFLYYLIFFSMIAAVVSRFRCPDSGWLVRRRWPLVLVPLALLPGVVGGGVPVPAPESFIPTWWPFAFYGLFYAAGWQLHGRETALETLIPYRWWIVAGSILIFIPYYASMPALDLSAIVQGSATVPRWAAATGSILTGYLSVTLTVAALLLGKKYLSRQNPWLKFTADSSYWVYLVHLPIVVFLQTLLIPLEWSLWLKLSVTILGTFATCLASYVIFVRYTPIGWLLNGKRSFP